MNATNKAWQIFWWLHQILHILALLGSVIVPFGLATLLYTSDTDYRRTLNINLLIVAAFSLICQLTNHSLRFAERSRRLRRVSFELRVALVKFNESDISKNELLTVYENCIQANMGEEGP